MSALTPDWVASLGGFIDVPKERWWQERIDLLEPPAGQRAPYVEPVAALEKLLRGQGMPQERAKAQALEAVVRMKQDIAEDRWVNFLDDFQPESLDCLPVVAFVAWLRGKHSGDQKAGVTPAKPDLTESGSASMLVPADILDFLEQAAEVSARTPMFHGPDNRNQPWSLETMPALPPPKAMIEFTPGPPWDDFEWGDWKTGDNPFLRWRESMRGIAKKLEQALGEPVYRFADLSSDIDDDDVHRFLVLHWCCTHKPESAFVRYLLKISKARDVEELKAALINPASYTQPFRMNDSSLGLEASGYGGTIDYLPPDKQKTVGVVFSTEAAREVAFTLLTHQIGVHAIVVAPKELATSDWVMQATRYCRGSTVRYLDEGRLDEPIAILAAVDEILVIADGPRPRSSHELRLAAPVEDLLWMALDLGLEAGYYQVDRMRSPDAQSCLRLRGVPERVTEQKARRAIFTRQLKEIRLDSDYCSSGLWDEQGRMLGYDQLDLPFALVRRLVRWQRDYDDTVTPPGHGSDAWWDHHAAEEIEIAQALQEAMGSHLAVKLYRWKHWLTLDEITQWKEAR